MAQISIVWKSQLEGAMRLDAEYYMPKYFRCRETLGKLNVSLQTLESLAKYITNGATPYHEDLTTGHVRFLTAEHVFDLHIAYTNSKFVKKKFHVGELKRTALKENDLLVTIKGKIGNAAVAFDLLGETNINQDVARVVLGDSINPFYVATFLDCKYGKLQSEQLSTNQINPFLGLGNLKQIKVPVFDNIVCVEVEELVRRSQSTYRQSESLYLQAEQLLLDELGFKDLDLSHQLCYTVPYKKTKEANRLDAEHFQPRYERTLALLAHSGLQVKDVARVRKERFKAKAGGSFNYIEIGSLRANGQADCENIMGEDAPSRTTWVVHANDVITSTVRPIRRLAALIESEQNRYVCSSGFVVLEPTGIEPEVLLAFLRLPLVCEILDLKTKASMYPAISTEDLLGMPISVPSEEVRQHIVQLISDAQQARQRARQLLEEAKRKVEEMIEKT